MVELVFVAIFNTHMCRKKLTKRQKYKKPNDFRQADVNKYIIVFARWSLVLLCAMLNFLEFFLCAKYKSVFAIR